MHKKSYIQFVEPKPKPTYIMGDETLPVSETKSVLSDQAVSKNIAKIKYNFTITQIIGIASFIGTTIVTLGYAFHSYLANVEDVKRLNSSEAIIQEKLVKIDSSINKQTGEIQTLKELFPKTK